MDDSELLTEVSAVVDNVSSAGFQGIMLLVLKVLIVYLVCVFAKKLLMGAMSRLMDRSKMEKGLSNFLLSVCNIILWMLIIMVLASCVGISPSPLLACFSILGLAASLAVQGSLSNFAGGINLLVFKVYVVGELIEINGDLGTVQDVGMSHTTMNTLDNRRVMVPNSLAMSGRVINYSREKLRRVDLSFSASYDANIEEVKKLIMEMIMAHPKTVNEPEAMVRVMSYGDSGIEYVVRIWCLQDDYWDVYFDCLEAIKPTLDANNISIPYPHVDLLMRNK